MIEDDLECDSDEFDPEQDLIDLADDYLDDLLSEEEAKAFEKRLLLDCEARDALVQSLTLRGILEYAARDLCEPGLEAECRECRAFIPAYHRDHLDPQYVGKLSQHLEECGECSGFYAEFAQASEKSRMFPRLFRVAGLVILGGALFSPLFWWLGSGIPDPGAVPTGPTRQEPTWPPLPVPEESLPGIIGLLAERTSEAETDPVSVAVAEICRSDRFFPTRAERQAPVAGLLTATGSEGLEGRARQEAVVLLAALHDDRLTADERREVLQPLCARLADPRPILWAVAQTAVEAPLLKECLTRLKEGPWQREDLRNLRRLFDRVLAVGAPDVLQLWLWCLADAGDPDTVALCKDVLMGRFGDFAGGEFPDVQGPLRWALERGLQHKRESSLREIAEIARTGPLVIGRLKALGALWSLDRDVTWHKAIVELARDPDRRVRREVVHHLRTYFDEGDREVLNNLASDSDREISGLAARVLQQLPDGR